jgi:Fur family peroxide stress response transcriptional regulator
MERTAKHFRKRDAILTCLRGTTVHPSADWIYEQLKAEHSDI